MIIAISVCCNKINKKSEFHSKTGLKKTRQNNTCHLFDMSKRAMSILDRSIFQQELPLSQKLIFY